MNSRKTPILHVITTMNLGGAEKQLLILMQEQLSLGYDVYVSILKPKPELRKKIQSCGIKILTVGMSLDSLMKNRRFIRDKKNIVHAHLPRAELFSRLILISRSNTFIITKHNSENFGSGTRFGKLNWLSAIVCSRAQGVVAISHAVKEFMLTNHQVFRKDENKIEIIYYGAELTNEAPKPIRSKAFEFKLGTISRLVHQKNIEMQLEALKALNEKYLGRPWRLIIVGEGPEKESLKLRALNLDVAKEVEFRGKIENVGEFFAEIDVFLLTSKYEGFGLAILEAMTFNVPIVAVSVSAIPEVLGSLYPGLFSPHSILDFVEKIDKCREKNFCSSMTDSYQKRLEIFNIGKSARLLDRLYQRIEVEV